MSITSCDICNEYVKIRDQLRSPTRVGKNVSRLQKLKDEYNNLRNYHVVCNECYNQCLDYLKPEFQEDIKNKTLRPPTICSAKPPEYKYGQKPLKYSKLADASMNRKLNNIRELESKITYNILPYGINKLPEVPKYY